MNKSLLVSGLLLTSLACACSPNHAEEKPQGVLTTTQKQALDKANKVEDLLDKESKDKMQAADDATK